MSVEKLVEHFSALEDPRCAGKVDHRLIDILVIAVCAVIACAESWDDIQGQRMKDCGPIKRSPRLIQRLSGAWFSRESIKMCGVLRLRRLASGRHLRPWPGTLF